MSNIHSFPAPPTRPGIVSPRHLTRAPRPVTSLPSAGGRGGEYAIADVARPLGLRHKSTRVIIDTLRTLAKHEGMPLPRTPRLEKGALIRGPRCIVKNSRWDAGEFDAWLDGRGPSPVTATASAPTVRDALRENALRLAGAGR